MAKETMSSRVHDLGVAATFHPAHLGGNPLDFVGGNPPGLLGITAAATKVGHVVVCPNSGITGLVHMIAIPAYWRAAEVSLAAVGATAGEVNLLAADFIIETTIQITTAADPRDYVIIPEIEAIRYSEDMGVCNVVWARDAADALADACYVAGLTMRRLA